MLAKGSRIVVLGGSVIGIVVAGSVSRLRPDCEVVLLEPSLLLGGPHLRGVFYDSAEIYFDFGAHTIQETGHLPIDDVLTPSDSRLIIHAEDLAGLVFGGQLHDGARYPDFRGVIPQAELDSQVESLLSRPSSLQLDRGQGLAALAAERFGPQVATTMCDMISKTLGIDNTELAGYALDLFGVQRVVVEDERTWNVHSQNDSFRSAIGHPTPGNLPSQFRHGRRTIYGRPHGTRSMVSALVDNLGEVHVYTGAKDMVFSEGEPSLTFETFEGQRRRLTWDRLLVAQPANRFMQLIKPPTSMAQRTHVEMMPHAFVNLQIQTLYVPESHYWTVLDPPSQDLPRPFRVTNYSALAEPAEPSRFTVEFINTNLEDAALERSALEHLKDLGIVGREVQANFRAVERTPAGFPRPTIENMDVIRSQGVVLDECLPPLTTFIGTGTDPSRLFQSEQFEAAWRSFLRSLGAGDE